VGVGLEHVGAGRHLVVVAVLGRLLLVHGAANSFGTGADNGIASAPVKQPPVGSVRWKTIVYWSGVEIPEIRPPVAFAAPTI
jgi:hypothetical protein